MSAPWIKADYPGKKSLSKSEAMEALRSGPRLAWFEPWLRETTLRFPETAKRGGFGYAHIANGSEGPFEIVIRTFWTREELQWGLEALHGLHKRCDHTCDGLLYWTPGTTAGGPEVTSW